MKEHEVEPITEFSFLTSILRNMSCSLHHRAGSLTFLLKLTPKQRSLSNSMEFVYFAQGGLMISKLSFPTPPLFSALQESLVLNATEHYQNQQVPPQQAVNAYKRLSSRTQCQKKNRTAPKMAKSQVQLIAHQLINLLSEIKIWGFLSDSEIKNSLYTCKRMHMQTTGRKTTNN